MNMGHGLSSGNPTVTAAFRSALDHQLLLVLFLGLALAIVWNSVRTVRYRRAALAGRIEVSATPCPTRRPPPPAHLLRGAVDRRRPGPDPEFDAARPHLRGHHPFGRLLAFVGPARSGLRGLYLE